MTSEMNGRIKGMQENIGMEEGLACCFNVPVSLVPPHQLLFFLFLVF